MLHDHPIRHSCKDELDISRKYRQSDLQKPKQQEQDNMHKMKSYLAILFK